MTRRPLILDLLPDFHGATITDVTYWGTGEAERFKSATRDDDGVWSAPARIGLRPLNLHYITEFTVQRDGDTTTWAEGQNPNQWTCTIERKDDR